MADMVKGNDAIAEAAVRAGVEKAAGENHCRTLYGYACAEIQRRIYRCKRFPGGIDPAL